MTPFDYLLNTVLIGLVVLQMRGRRLDRRGLVLPVVLVLWAASQYLHGIPTAGNDLFVVALGVLTGTMFGLLSGVLTKIHRGSDGVAVARATAGAAAFWIVGIGARMGFALYATHGGRAAIGQFSFAHHVTPQAWVTALVLMAFAEVLSRTAMLWTRSRAIRPTSAPALAIG